MKLLNYDNVLCLSPHPDDVEFSMSGLIKKYEDTNFIILTLTEGTSSDVTSGSYRIEEVKKFWEDLDVNNVTVFHMKKEFDKMHDGEWISIIENELEVLELPEIDAIFGTSSDDTHYEHHIVNRLLHSLGRNKLVSLFEYKSPSTKESWNPNFFVDITDQCDLKINALSNSFESQLDSPYFKLDLLEQFNTNYIISKLGCNRVESFKIIRKILKG